MYYGPIVYTFIPVFTHFQVKEGLVDGLYRWELTTRPLMFLRKTGTASIT